MNTLKDMWEALYVDDKIRYLFEYLTDNKMEKEINQFYMFYKIQGEIKEGTMIVLMYFQHENKWREIAKLDINTKRFISHIDKKLFKVLLEKENNYIENNFDKELQRSANIIFSIIALIIGAVVAFVISKLIM